MVATNHNDMAMIGGNVECCQLLCQRGANPDQLDWDRDMPQNCANDDPKMWELLFRASNGMLLLNGP
jgi:hypothetical protein